MDSKRLRRHGLAGRPNCYQFVSWMFTLGLSSLFYSLLFPSCPSAASQCALAGFTACAFVAFMSYLKCSLTDPSDAGVLHRLEPTAARPPQTFTHFCVKCQANVQSTSKHCRACNRCTEGFDHHCVWINNCVGKKNYKWFLGLIISLEGMVLAELGTAGLLLVHIFKGGLRSNETVEKYDIGDYGVCYISAVICVAFLCLVFCLSNGYLIAFHIMLKIRRLTTLEFIAKGKTRNSKVRDIKYVASELKDSAIIDAQEPSSSLQERSHLHLQADSKDLSFTSHLPNNTEKLNFSSA